MPEIVVWVPEATFPRNKPVFFMSATHRGDMYAVRAAMAIERGEYRAPLLLHDCDPNVRGNKEVIDYLSGFARSQNRPVFLVPWSWAQISSDNIANLPTQPASDAPGALLNLRGCSLNGQPVPLSALNNRKTRIHTISEGACTDRIQQARVDVIPTILNNMALIPANQRAALEAEYERLNPFRGVPDVAASTTTKNVLVLHRDSGIASVGGAYPELDSGGALFDLAGVVASIKGATGQYNLNVIFYGAAAHPNGTLIRNGDQIQVKVDGKDLTITVYSIGKYWETLSGIRIADGLGALPSTRDIEAHFFRWAFETKRHYSLALGFRSGALDLFTFLAVPTVSISLRGLIGNLRHNDLAAPKFKRVNCEYDTPRHAATAWITGRYPQDNPVPDIASPYWNGTAPAGVVARAPVQPASDAENLRLRQEGGPGPLTTFDRSVVFVAMMLCLDRHHNDVGLNAWADMLRKWGAAFPGVIRTKQARKCYSAALDTPDKIKAYFGPLKAADNADLVARRAKQAVLQESAVTLTGYEEGARIDWMYYARFLEANPSDS